MANETISITNANGKQIQVQKNTEKNRKSVIIRINPNEWEQRPEEIYQPHEFIDSTFPKHSGYEREILTNSYIEKMNNLIQHGLDDTKEFIEREIEVELFNSYLIEDDTKIIVEWIGLYGRINTEHFIPLWEGMTGEEWNATV